MKLIDQYGNPFETRTLREPQTARVAALAHQQVESQLDGLTPAAAARILRDADRGDIVAQHRLFDDMLDRDAHLRCEFDKRAGALLGLDWRIAPPADASAAEKRAAAWVEGLLRDAVDDLEDVIVAMMDAVGHGFAPVEIEWQRFGTEFIPRFHARPQTWFRLDVTRRELRLDDGSGDGVAPLAMGWIMHRHRKVKTGYGGRMGLLRGAVWPFLYKAYGIGDFAEFLETYGLPMIVGKYMAGASSEEKASLMRAVTALGHDARAIMPDGMALEIKEITGGAGGSHHLAMVDWADRAQSKLLLGQTTSSEARATGLGSGVADLHSAVREDIRAADARQIAGTLTRDLVYPLLALNGFGPTSFRRCPRWVFDQEENADLALFAEAMPALAAGGAQIPVAWVHEKLRIPQATGSEPVFGAAPSLPAKAAAQAALTAQTLVQPVPAPDPVALALPPLVASANMQVDAWLADIETLLAGAASLDDFRAQLLTRYPDLPTETLTALLADALLAAELAGRAEVIDGD